MPSDKTIQNRFTKKLNKSELEQEKEKIRRRIELEALCGRAVSKYLGDLINNCYIRLIVKGTGMYRRLLADIYLMEGSATTSVNQMLLDKGFAVPYGGKTKIKFTDRQLHNILKSPEISNILIRYPDIKK